MNRVVFTARAPAGTQAARLQRYPARPLAVTLAFPARALLEGRELEAWERARAAERSEQQQVKRPVSCFFVLLFPALFLLFSFFRFFRFFFRSLFILVGA